jgi:hypothetical protein
MPDYAGPLQRLVLSRTLWLVLAWPIGGFAWQVLVVRRRIARARDAGAAIRALASGRNAGLACTALALASTLAHTVVLSRASQGGAALFQHVAPGARVGQLDAQINLCFDALSATFCLLACTVALAVSAFVATRPVGGRGWQTWGWLQLALAGALVTFVADGFVGMAVGWALVAAAGAWLGGWNDARAGVVAATRSAVAITAMLVGAVLLFWALGGSWEGDEYTPDSLPRFAAVHAGEWTDRDNAQEAGGGAVAAGGGWLTCTSAPGAIVFVDEARTPSMHAPFVRAPVSAGTHAFRIRSGDGSNDEILNHVAFAEGEEIAFVPLGPSLSFRAIADQLLLRDRDGNTTLRNALEARAGPGGTAVVATSLIALLVAAGVISGGPSASGTALALGALAYSATTAALGPYLLARMAFLFPLAPSTWLAVESVGAAILLGASWRAPAFSGMRRWLAFVGAAPPALALLALGAVGIKPAMYVMVLAGAASAALHLVAAHAAAQSRDDDALVVRGPIDDLLLIRVPERLGSLLLSMDRWVVGSTGRAFAALVRAGAWVVSSLDEHVVGAPSDVVAAKVLGVGRRVEPWLGVPLGRLVWAVVAAVAFTALAHSFWPGR